MRADEIMTDEVTTIDETATVGQAYEIMESEGIRHLPVMRGRELVGMLSDRDLRSYGLSMVADLEEVERTKARLGAAVARVMSSDVIAVAPDADVVDVIDLMMQERIHAVPVVDDGTSDLMGIVTTFDVLGAARGRMETD